jgi:hypothetical protein
MPHVVRDIRIYTHGQHPKYWYLQVDKNNKILFSLYRTDDNTNEFPRFFKLNDEYIKLDRKGNRLVASTAKGASYPPLQILLQGREISEEEFSRHVYTACKL